MLQIRSILDVADNTGAKRAAAIGVLGRNQRYAGIGDIIKAHIKEGAHDQKAHAQEPAESPGRHYRAGRLDPYFQRDESRRLRRRRRQTGAGREPRCFLTDSQSGELRQNCAMATECIWIPLPYGGSCPGIGPRAVLDSQRSNSQVAWNLSAPARTVATPASPGRLAVRWEDHVAMAAKKLAVSQMVEVWLNAGAHESNASINDDDF